jgi:hypothetical protein
VQAEGDTLVIRGPKRAEPVARLLLDHKLNVLAALAPRRHEATNCDASAAERASWRDKYSARIVHWFRHGQRPWEEADFLAFGEMVLEWHRRYGTRRDPRRCAACGDDLPDDSGLTVDREGVRVHLDAVRGIACIIAYGTRWRGASVAGLHAVGIEPPAWFELL